jgi:hypothetical protein
MKLGPRRNSHPHACFKTFIAKIRGPGPSEDYYLDWAIARMYTEARAAVIADRPHIATAKAVAKDHCGRPFREFLSAVRNLNSVGGSRRVESVKVRVHPKNRRPVSGIVAADAFEHSAPVVKRMRRHVHGCVAPVCESAIHPYPVCFIK